MSFLFTPAVPLWLFFLMATLCALIGILLGKESR